MILSNGSRCFSLCLLITADSLSCCAHTLYGVETIVRKDNRIERNMQDFFTPAKRPYGVFHRIFPLLLPSFKAFFALKQKGLSSSGRVRVIFLWGIRGI